MVSKLFYAEDWKLPFSCFVNSIYFCVRRKFLLETAGVKELVLNFYSYNYVGSNVPSIFTVAVTVRVYWKIAYFVSVSSYGTFVLIALLVITYYILSIQYDNNYKYTVLLITVLTLFFTIHL